MPPVSLETDPLEAVSLETVSLTFGPAPPVESSDEESVVAEEEWAGKEEDTVAADVVMQPVSMNSAQTGKETVAQETPKAPEMEWGPTYQPASSKEEVAADVCSLEPVSPKTVSLTCAPAPPVESSDEEIMV